MSKELVIVPEELRRQALAFPDVVSKKLAEIEDPREANDLLNMSVAFEKYVQQLKAGVEIERPIALGVLKIKAKIGELSPPAKGGRGKKTTAAATGVLASHTLAAYRQLAKHQAKLDKWCASLDDVPTQGDFLRFVNGAHVSRNSGEIEWYTPQHIVDCARKVLGGIDLDPATCSEAQKVVKASRYFTATRCGLTNEWYEKRKLRIWMNPPYSHPLLSQFCEKLAGEWDAGHVAAACVLVNNGTDTEWFYVLSRKCAAICFPRGRIKFWYPERASFTPLQGQAVIYLGREPRVFCKEFAKYGKCFRSA